MPSSRACGTVTMPNRVSSIRVRSTKPLVHSMYFIDSRWCDVGNIVDIRRSGEDTGGSGGDGDGDIGRWWMTFTSLVVATDFIKNMETIGTAVHTM